MDIKLENKKYTIQLVGKVDTASAPDIEKEIWAGIDFDACDAIDIDASGLTMISSVGLRIILKLRKKCQNIRVFDLNSDVYEVFELTGFTEMVTVEKAFRKVDVSNCEKLGEGSNGIVYRYDPEIVIKVYKHADALDEIKRERQLARDALVRGIPTAIPFDVVKVGDLYGSVFELLKAESFSKLISKEPEKTDYYIGLFVDLLKKIHETKANMDLLNDMNATGKKWVDYAKDYLPADQGEKLTALMNAVPETDTLIHGDYHTSNVRMQDGEILLIDMETLSHGHPVFEFASMYLGFVGFGELDNSVTLKFLGLSYDKTNYIWKKTLELYFDTTDWDFLSKIEDKIKLIAYTRLLRRTIKRIGFEDEQGKATIECCKKHIAELLEKVDSLIW